MNEIVLVLILGCHVRVQTFPLLVLLDLVLSLGYFFKPLNLGRWRYDVCESDCTTRIQAIIQKLDVVVDETVVVVVVVSVEF